MTEVVSSNTREYLAAERAAELAALITTLETSLDLHGPYTTRPTEDGVKVIGRDSRGRFASAEIVDDTQEGLAA